MLVAAVLELANCGLLRTPRVYNTLITSNQNLTPSRAYPVVQPILQETRFLYPAYGLRSYGILDPYSPFNSFADTQKFYTKLNNRSGAVPSLVSSEISKNEYNTNIQNGDDNRNDPQVNRDSYLKQEDNYNRNMGRPPIPLNEFGLQPSLIPLSTYDGAAAINQNPVELAPYPLIYDQYAGYQQGPYLPPFDYIPQTSFSNYGDYKNINKQPNQGEHTKNDFNNFNNVKRLPNESGNHQYNNEIPGNSQAPPINSVDSSNGQNSSNQNSYNFENKQNYGQQTSINDYSPESKTIQSQGQLRNQEVNYRSQLRPGYFTDDITNNKNRNANIVDVPPPPLPFGAKSAIVYS